LFLSNIAKMDSIKDVQASGEAFSRQKRTSSTSKDEIYQVFYIFLGHFCPLGSGSGLRIPTPFESVAGSTTLVLGLIKNLYRY
jgi:hypothetical protein